MNPGGEQGEQGGICLPQTKTEFQPMTETNVGANLMFAFRTKTINKPISEKYV